MLVFVMCDMDHVMYTSRDPYLYSPGCTFSLSLSLLSLCGAAELVRRAPPPLFISS